jgi:hypothetical protein
MLPSPPCPIEDEDFKKLDIYGGRVHSGIITVIGITCNKIMRAITAHWTGSYADY